MTVLSFDVESTADPGVLRIDVSCSAGTYIRTLADDLGRLLGGAAHLRNLRRTAVGAFTVDQAGPPDECELLPVATAVRSLDRVVVDDDTAGLVANGRVLARFEGSGPWALFDDQGVLLAVYEPFRDREAKPSVVLPTAIGR